MRKYIVRNRSKRYMAVMAAALIAVLVSGCKETGAMADETEVKEPAAIVARNIIRENEETSATEEQEYPVAEDPENPATENQENFYAEDPGFSDAGEPGSETAYESQAGENAQAGGNKQAGENAQTGDGFYIKEIDDGIFARIEGKSYKADCTLPREDLRYLHVLHKNIEGDICEGEMIVNVHIAEDVLDIFKELYDISYPIEKIRLIDEYDADDELSMEDNNTSSFNFRVVSGSGHLSKHALGMAIDINPLYNPYITASGTKVEPINAVDYADRSLDFEYKIDEEDEAYKVFTEHGFFWGGAWKNTKDYQHFEITTEKIREYYSWY